MKFIMLLEENQIFLKIYFFMCFLDYEFISPTNNNKVTCDDQVIFFIYSHAYFFLIELWIDVTYLGRFLLWDLPDYWRRLNTRREVLCNKI